MIEELNGPGEGWGPEGVFGAEELRWPSLCSRGEAMWVAGGRMAPPVDARSPAGLACGAPAIPEAPRYFANSPPLPLLYSIQQPDRLRQWCAPAALETAGRAPDRCAGSPRKGRLGHGCLSHRKGRLGHLLQMVLLRGRPLCYGGDPS